ncbi:hypothetical protein RMHFA_05700 [Roseomonas mucosa]|nr:hypothetical protein RMHFA_05700 [Roseomonas mucosa]
MQPYLLPTAPSGHDHVVRRLRARFRADRTRHGKRGVTALLDPVC